MSRMNKYTLHMCARCRRSRKELQIRRCNNPAVNRKLGEYICYDCCKKCKYHVKHPLCGAIGCDYTDTGN